VATALVVCLVFSLAPPRLARADNGAGESTVTLENSAAKKAARSAPVVAEEKRPAAAPSGDAVQVEQAFGEAHSTAAATGTLGADTAHHAPILSTSPSKVQSLPVGGDKTGVSSQAISLPQGVGKVQGMGESFSINPSTGVANFDVPFSLVPARGVSQPSLALHYSTAFGHGVAGVGWDVAVPYITRQTDRGGPQYVDPPMGGGWSATQDRFVFNGGQELVPICLVSGGACGGALTGEAMPSWAEGSQYFRPRVEGAYMRFFWSPDHKTWRVQSKTGETLELGVPLDGSGDKSGLEVDPSNPTHIFRWDLARSYDAYGTANPADATTAPAPANQVVYRYLLDGGMSYLADIYDTPPAANLTAAPLSAYSHHTHLSYATRPDATFSFRRGWQVTQGLRLVGVDVTSENFGATGVRELVRRYHLAYDPNFHVSLLTSVQMEGRCDQPVPEDSTGALPATSCSMLPSMAFDYQHVAPFDTTGGASTADIPGWEGFDERVHAMANSPNHSVDETLTDLFDINADGLPDVVVTAPNLYNGKDAVFRNGAGGKVDAFGANECLDVTGVTGEDTNIIRLDNPNVSPHDIDGDGIIDLLHMPMVKTYSVYTPQAGGCGWLWQGRSITTASQQSPKIDFTNNNQNIHVMDVNGDGLVDVVFSSGTEYQTFLSLGRYPGPVANSSGDGQYGSAYWTSSTTASISNDPITSCLPWSSTPALLGDGDVKIGDMNGDGLPDIVRIRTGDVRYWPGRGNGFWGTGDPTDCPGGTFGQNRDIAMSASPEIGVVDSTQSLLLDDINGDGLDDIVKVEFDAVYVWLNVDGTSWAGPHIIRNAPQRVPSADRVRLVDANGSGTRDLLYGDAYGYRYMDVNGGARPWVLTHVANGLGKTTDLQYSTSTQLMLAAEAAGQAWASKAPMPIPVITQVTESDHLDTIGLPAGNYVTQYSYRDPVYDGRQREFRGFRTTSERKVGDANSPSSTSTTTFLLGECVNDENLPLSPCTTQGRWEDNPREALKGLPLTSETVDDNGVYLSTKHTTYRLRKLYAGLDGREVRAAFGSSADTFLYDTGQFKAAASTTSVKDVELETTLGTVTSDVTPTTPLGTEQLALRATAGTAHLQTSAVVDPFGNATDAIDAGCVDGCASGDEVITKHTTPGRGPDASPGNADPSGWMWRPIESYVTGSVSGTREDQFFIYNADGSLTQTDAGLVGSLPLYRHHETAGAQVATPLAVASQDGRITIDTKQYDNSVGVLTQTCGANGSMCRSLTWDASFKELPVLETDYVGTPDNSGRGGTPLSTIAQYDRGLHVVTQVVDLHGELTTALYDGFGRITQVSKPDPDPNHVGQTSPEPSVTIAYQLPGDPTHPTQTAYSVILTQLVQDDTNPSNPVYRQLIATVDGMGRPILSAEQADPNLDGAPWIVDKLTIYDGKGAAAQAYEPWFTSAQPPSVPIVPQSTYSRARFDAFGHALQTFGIDGAQTLQNVYHALSVEHWDAADLQSGGPHQGTFASEVHDGHGRTVTVSERVHNGNAIEQHDLRTQYLATGQPVVISRVRVGAPDAAVVRWLQYDSLGRMVLNVEPDTTVGFVGPPTNFAPTPTAGIPDTSHAWRYAYDNNGQLVGTSDARGCGANYYYDAGGRIVAEDFSPCLALQQIYSLPDLSTGDGTEAFYQYDGYTNVELPPAGFPSASLTLGLGRLVAVSDRGAKTVKAFDGRGRVVAVGRQIVGPDPNGPYGPNGPNGPNNTLADRYAPTWSTRNFTYDAADRPVDASTGADVSELLPSGSASSQSTVTTHYSQRGTLSSVSSTYGPLVSRVLRDADGNVNQIAYGDTAGTTSAFTYDLRRRLSSVQTYRGPPASWSQTPAAYLPAPTPNGPPNTFQLLLEDVDYHYDAVDNPVEIDDWRVPSEWPAGAQPVSRKIQYDDLYRATRVDYTYPNGTDPWTSPFEVEDSGTAPDPRLALPSPHIHFANRVLRQTFQYDWLGNTTATDDDVHGFYDRSLGTITNGTANAGPYQLTGASAADPNLGGSLTTGYDAAGNLTSLVLSRAGNCLPSGANCSQRFVYDWDEVGRLARARRWDLAAPGAASNGAATVDLAYIYDSSDNRVLKAATDSNNNSVYTAYIFSSLELRRAVAEGADYARSNATEVVYLAAHDTRLARLHAPTPDETLPAPGGETLHVLLEVPDHLASTSIVVDRDTSEVVERGTYMAYGQADSDYRPTRWARFREDYRFTGKEDDVEVGLSDFGARYYSPFIGRWVSADPLTVHGLGADPNNYAYVHGRLLVATDPIGLEDPWWAAPYMRVVLDAGDKVNRWYGKFVEATVGGALMSVMGGGDAHAPEDARNNDSRSPETPYSHTGVNVAAYVSGGYAGRVLGRAVGGMLGAALDDAAESGAGKWLTRDALGTGFTKGAYQTPLSLLGQCESFSCTAAATRNLLADRGIQMGEDKIAQAIGTTEDGTILKDVPTGLSRLGVEGAKFFPKLSFEQLSKLVNESGPSLVGTRIPGTGPHTMIVDKIEAGTVFLRDTLPGNTGASYSISASDFNSIWKGTAVELPPNSAAASPAPAEESTSE
jgi:RHS repeat-associated protein